MSAALLREEHFTVLGLNIPTTNATRDNTAIIIKTVSILHFILELNNKVCKTATVERNGQTKT